MKTGIKTKGMSGKPIVTEAPYGYVKDPDNKDFWIIDEEAAEVVRLIFPSVYRWEKPQPNRRASEKRANPYPHFLYERPRGGEPVKIRRSTRITAASGTKPP